MPKRWPRTPTLRPRIGLARDLLSIRIALLDDQVGRVSLHYALDLGKLVRRGDREAGRLSPNRLVLGHRHRNPLYAVSAPTLTCEVDRFALGLHFDEVRRNLDHALVHLAEQRLVQGETFLSCPHEGNCLPTRPEWQGLMSTRWEGPSLKPTWGSPVRTEDVFRQANESVAAKAGELEVAYPVPFLCECPDRHCFAGISLTLDDYAKVRSDPGRYLTIPGHETSRTA